MVTKSPPRLQAVNDAYLNSTEITATMFNPEETTADMNQASREEIHALLAANKAEMESIASSISAEMALSREKSNTQLTALNLSLNSLSSKIDGKMDSVNGDIRAITGKFEGIQGQISGINTAIGGIQSGISTRLAVFGIIIAFVVAIPGLISALKDSQPSQQAASQPIIIQVPQQSVTPPQLQQKSGSH